MESHAGLLFLLGILAFCAESYAAPKFNDVYTVKGTLYIPYAEIREPFYAWYDVKSRNSRIDYYGGEYTSM